MDFSSMWFFHCLNNASRCLKSRALNFPEKEDKRKFLLEIVQLSLDIFLDFLNYTLNLNKLFEITDIKNLDL